MNIAASRSYLAHEKKKREKGSPSSISSSLKQGPHRRSRRFLGSRYTCQGKDERGVAHYMKFSITGPFFFSSFYYVPFL
jgi:hypothetical protein